MNLFGFLGQYPWLVYLSGALQVIFLIHVVVTRRNFYWIFILLIGSYLAVLAYLFIEVLPNLRGNARRVGANLQPALENLRPLETRIRDARERIEESDTLSNRTDLAALLARAGREAEAQDALQPLLSGIYADDPLVLLTSAELALARRDPASAAALLGRVDLKTSASIRTRTLTLLAGAQAEQTQVGEADATYQAALMGATSEEPRVRYAQFLMAQNRPDEARAQLGTLARTEKRAGGLYRSQEREWFQLAGKLRRELS
ncbi:hypothetical protein [Deinococcus sp.]|uniref:hypothetical protein n=1 Tax=Deinococcus sp. TaxID=47478 RepID=UPI00260132E0|nr:hypothetical protein [Deinococcus sp.]